METRRFILALSLSLIVFLVYVRFFAPKPPEKPPVPEQAQQEAGPAESREAAQHPRPSRRQQHKKIVPAARARTSSIETDLVKASSIRPAA